MGFVRLFLGLVVREHAIKLWPYLLRRSPISQMPYSVLDRPQIGLSNPQPCDCEPAIMPMYSIHVLEPPVRVPVREGMCDVQAQSCVNGQTSPNPSLGPPCKISLSFLVTIDPMLLDTFARAPLRQTERQIGTQLAHRAATELSSDVGRGTWCSR